MGENLMQSPERFNDPEDSLSERFLFPSNDKAYMSPQEIIEKLCKLDLEILRERLDVAVQEYEQRKAEEWDDYTLAKKLLDDFGINYKTDSLQTRTFKLLFPRSPTPFGDKERIVSQANQFMYRSLNRNDHRDYIFKNKLNLDHPIAFQGDRNLIYASYYMKYHGTATRVAYCYRCRKELTPSINHECTKCIWMKCPCGACACNYTRFT